MGLRCGMSTACHGKGCSQYTALHLHRCTRYIVPHHESYNVCIEFVCTALDVKGETLRQSTLVWTETREELNVLFTRAQQAQNDNYKKNIDNIG